MPVSCEKNAINWRKFLSRQDLVWNHLPQSWTEGAFAGNGLLGVMVYADKDLANTIGFELGRADVNDHRTAQNCENYSKFADTPYTNQNVFNRCRLPIGRLRLTLDLQIESAVVRMELYDAKITGTVQTQQGGVTWQAYVARNGNVLVLQVNRTGTQTCTVTFAPYPGSSPRQYTRPNKEYRPNPACVCKTQCGINLCVQPMLAGGEYATAWQELPAKDGESTILAAVGYSQQASGDSAQSGSGQAVRTLTDAAANLQGIEQEHRDWWHEFYSRSFLSFPDKRLEQFYWLQIYKAGSASRQDGPVIDTCGPWLKFDTGWPCVWWNLNVQLTYWIYYAANHSDLAQPLLKALDRHMDTLIANTPKEFRGDSAFIGNPTGQNLANNRLYTVINNVATGEKQCALELNCLPWVCHNYWVHYRCTMDDGLLQKLYPLMRRTFCLYLHLLNEGEDGRLHLPAMFSAEYGIAEDTNQDLAILRWGCQTLLQICERLSVDDPLIPRWKDILSRLADPPCDEHGLMIGKDMPYAISHRHFSHLMAIFPFYLLNVDRPQDKALIEKSVSWWIEKEDGKRLAGYSFTGAALMMTAQGDGDRALQYLYRLLDRQIHPNTMYTESGDLYWPTIETPLTCGKALQDMVLQSWGEKIRVFPAVPKDWKDVLFYTLRAEGAFDVSAQREDGKTRWIEITSLAGERCLVVTDMENPIITGTDGSVRPVRRLADGALALPLAKGETVRITAE